MECPLLIIAPGDLLFDKSPPLGNVVGTPARSFPTFDLGTSSSTLTGYSLSRSLSSRACPKLHKLCRFSFARVRSSTPDLKRRKITIKEPPALRDGFSSSNIDVKLLIPECLNQPVAQQPSGSRSSGKILLKDHSLASESIDNPVPLREGHVYQTLIHANNPGGCGCCKGFVGKGCRREESSHMRSQNGSLLGIGQEVLRISGPALPSITDKGDHAKNCRREVLRNVDDLKSVEDEELPRELLAGGQIIPSLREMVQPDHGTIAVELGECLVDGVCMEKESVAVAEAQKTWQFEVLASVQCQKRHLTFMDVIGTIAFEKTNEFFATGGIARKIRVYEYQSLVSGVGLADVDDDGEDDDEDEEYMASLKHRRLRKRSNFLASTDHARCCVQEVCTPAKLSSLQWHQERNNVIACGDYDGVVAEWDVERACAISERDEHGGQRIWSIDYSKDSPALLASASDDATLRMWDRSSDQSVAILYSPSRSPICCAEFGPRSSSLLALACADSNVYVYDTRNLSHPLLTLQHHERAASYVRFMNRHTLVSSSIDSSVKLWDISSVDSTLSSFTGFEHSLPARERLLKTFDSHRNVRNFTGLSVWAEGGLIACGSETNQAYAYDCYKTSPILVHDFAEAHHQPGESRGVRHETVKGSWESDAHKNMMVSAVCWRTKADGCTLVAANSDGVLRVISGRRA